VTTCPMKVLGEQSVLDFNLDDIIDCFLPTEYLVKTNEDEDIQGFLDLRVC